LLVVSPQQWVRMAASIAQIALGLLISTLIGWAAYRRGSLTRSGWLGAIITGTLTFGFGGLPWGMALIMFFLTSSLLSRFRQREKERVAGEKFEKGGRRDLWQALANGGVGALIALAYGLVGQPIGLLACFAGVLATVTADTWATEIGILSARPPLLITTLRPIAPGTSGGVSAVGLAASAAGALMIGIVLILGIALTQSHWFFWLLPASIAGGVAGSLADSVLGATLQAMYAAPQGETERSAGRDGRPHTLVRGLRWMNNDAVNLLSSLVGGAVALVIALLLQAA
jgi:uncharacterized protein (TIGR00297 family)